MDIKKKNIQIKSIIHLIDSQWAGYLISKEALLYIENPKDSIRKLLSNEFSKVSGHKINTQKSLAFLYTNKEKPERELRNKSHSPLQQKELNI